MTSTRKVKGIWIPIEVWRMEVPGMQPIHRCLYAEIDSLSKPGNPCRASNGYLAKFFQVSLSTISRSVSWLHERKLIRVWYKGGGNRLRCMEVKHPNQIDKGSKQIDMGPSQIDKGSSQIDMHRIPLEYPLEYPESVSAKKINQVAEDLEELKNLDRNSSPQVARRPPSGNRKKQAVLFSETRYLDYAVFVDQFADPDFELVDLKYYHERLKAWSEQGNKRKSWIAVARMFMLNDRKDGKLVLITHSNTKKNGSQIIDLEQVRRLARRPETGGRR